MTNRLKNYFQNKAIYWGALSLFEQKVSFRTFRQLFVIRQKFREEKISSRILSHSMRNILWAGVYAAIFVFGIEYFSHLAKNVSFALGKNELGLLISTVVTVTGVFLGLYFTALSAVAGNLFMRAPEDLQRLFLRDRKGYQYIRTLALTAIVGIYYLLLMSFGYKVGFLGPIVIALLALYAVVRFIALGSQTFYFIHPSEASSTVIADAANAIDSASAGGFGWKKSYLQKHYRRQAKESFRTLNSLIVFGVDVIKLSDQQLVDIAKYAGGLLDYYLERKKRIPTDSEWFDTKQQHQNWLLADSSEITMALNTGTSLAPKSSKDNLWFEDACVHVILKIFETLVARNQWDYATACIETIISVLDETGRNLYLEEAKLIMDKVQKAIDPVAINSVNPTDDNAERGQLALIDSLGRVSTGLLVSLIKHLDKRTCSDVVAEINKTKWDGKTSVYKSELPGKMLSRIETTKKGIDVEKGMEGQRISPDWYITTITSQQYLQELEKFYSFIKSMHKEVFEAKVNELIMNKKPLHAAHMTERWLEFSSKMQTCGALLEKLVEDCKGQKKVHDLPWPDIDFAAERTALQNNDKLANDKLLELLPVLSALPQPNLLELPDYFGQAYTFGVMAAYQACYDNDAIRLKKAFPAVLIGVLKAHELLREQTTGWSDESKIIFSTEPLEDLLVLSGFIKIYSELYENEEMWTVCETAWNGYLSVTDAKTIIQTLVAFTTYRDGIFKIMPKAILRQNWDFNLHSKLEELGLSTGRLPTPMTGSERNVDHNSPLVRVMARRSDLMDFDARNVFYVTYLSRHEAAEGIKFPDGFNLEGSLKREKGGKDEEQTA